MDSNITNASASNATECQFNHYDDLEVKFYLLIIFTPVVAFVGVLVNSLAITAFLTRPMRTTNNAFLLVLAICDIGVLVTAVLIYSVEVASDYYKSVPMYAAWISYLKVSFLTSHTFQLAGVYMTVAATIERGVALLLPPTKLANLVCSIKTVPAYAVIIFICSFSFVFPKFLEIDVIDRPQCTGFAQWDIQQSELAMDQTFDLIYNVWLSNFISLLLPFIILLLLNIMIIVRLAVKRKPGRTTGAATASQLSRIHMAYLGNISNTEDIDQQKLRKCLQQKRREETILLIIAATVFLLFASPEFALTITEYVAKDFLFENREFYGIMRDTTNMLTIVNCFINPIMYFIFSKEFRTCICRLFSCFRQGSRDKTCNHEVAKMKPSKNSTNPPKISNSAVKHGPGEVNNLTYTKCETTDYVKNHTSSKEHEPDSLSYWNNAIPNEVNGKKCSDRAIPSELSSEPLLSDVCERCSYQSKPCRCREIPISSSVPQERKTCNFCKLTTTIHEDCSIKPYYPILHGTITPKSGSMTTSLASGEQIEVQQLIHSPARSSTNFETRSQPIGSLYYTPSTAVVQPLAQESNKAQIQEHLWQQYQKQHQQRQQQHQKRQHQHEQPQQKTQQHRQFAEQHTTNSLGYSEIYTPNNIEQQHQRQGQQSAANTLSQIQQSQNLTSQQRYHLESQLQNRPIYSLVQKQNHIQHYGDTHAQLPNSTFTKREFTDTHAQPNYTAEKQSSNPHNDLQPLNYPWKPQQHQTSGSDPLDDLGMSAMQRNSGQPHGQFQRNQSPKLPPSILDRSPPPSYDEIVWDHNHNQTPFLEPRNINNAPSHLTSSNSFHGYTSPLDNSKQQPGATWQLREDVAAEGASQKGTRMAGPPMVENNISRNIDIVDILSPLGVACDLETML